MILNRFMKNRRRISAILFYVALVTYLVSLMLGQTAYFQRNLSGYPGRIQVALEMLSYLLFIGKVILDPPLQDNKKLIILVAMLVSFLISGFMIEHKFFFLTAIIFIAAIGMDDEKTILTSLIVSATILIVVLVLSKIGLAENVIFYQVDRTREALGFGWMTTPPILLYYIELAYIYIRKEKFKWYEVIVLLCANYYLYKHTLTRLTFLLAVIVIIFFYVQTIEKKWKKPWSVLKRFKYLYLATPTLLTIISYIAAKSFDVNSEKWNKVDLLLNARLSLTNLALNEYGITLFGQPIEWVGAGILNNGYADNYNYVDCSYLQLLMTYGIIPYLFIIGIYTYGLYKGIKRNNYWAVFVLLAVLAHSITEPHLIGFSMNILVLLPLTDIRECLGNNGTEVKSV